MKLVLEFTIKPEYTIAQSNTGNDVYLYSRIPGHSDDSCAVIQINKSLLYFIMANMSSKAQARTLDEFKGAVEAAILDDDVRGTFTVTLDGNEAFNLEH